MATKDGLAQIWYADANGVITGNTPSADIVASAIIDGYNEHFGTNIQIWTPETKNLQVGDTVPSWNAYEKITIQGYFAVNFEYNVFGYLKEGIFETPRHADGQTYTADNNGVIISQTVVPPGAPGYDGFVQAVKDRFLQNNIIVNEIVGKIESYSVGDNIANWNEYTKI